VQRLHPTYRTMLKKTQLKEIADRLGWRFEETRLAVEELRKFTSIKNLEGFLKVCVNANEPEERWQKIIRFLLINLKGDLVKDICDLLQIDPCFYALALFNFYDLQLILKLEGTSYRVRFRGEKKSFIYWSYGRYNAVKDLTIRSIASLKAQKKISSTREVEMFIYLYRVDKQDIRKFPEEFIYSPSGLTYTFLDILLHYKLMASVNPKTGIPELNFRKLFMDVARLVRFLAFNIAQFRYLASDLYYNPYKSEENKKFLAELTTILLDPDLNRNEITKRRNWLIYTLVETLKKKYTIRDTYKKVGKHLNNSPKSIHRRYFDMKKEAKEKNLTLEDIIKQFGLFSDEKLRLL
jgi:hypothetical protein